MEPIRDIHRKTAISDTICASNDNERSKLSFGQSLYGENAVALIFKPCRSVTTSGKARTKGWRLVFERSSALFIEPLMGYTGDRDTLTQVELEFPTPQSAIRYAERHGLTYVVQRPAAATATPETGRRTEKMSHAFADATLDRLGLAPLRDSYGQAMDGATNRGDASGPATWSSPMDIVVDPSLSLQAKRSILMNWAWTEYLLDQATNEGLPKNDRPSRLHEVEQALLVLERDVELAQTQSVADRETA
ncbi:NADH dehydrogenase ubiquinone Fe-S protein 4 [Rhizobium lentis]|uniref:NADH dehydrogenase ubiquinone Fe-S protein 4 n=1 Tax=Rhizobium lentis TaxID=1138194 RepID=UPI001C8389D3|nr:NADH dehydrogenase ubiquinone Fe-S protein 4 [Rhizobium lentis]MBX5050831.1 ETC complex I subunit [Rhizobium lentis]MBX5062845.1 ETC complex I subunit [Rhizobium lentis]